jgi:small GTP-binding protein
METKEIENDQNNGETDKEINNEFEILSNDTPQFDHRYKIIVIGDSGVGKTCLSERITTGKFNDKNQPTLGFDYYPLYLKYKKYDTILKLEIWDTCGQEDYRALIKSFFANSSLAIVVYAINDEKSFNSIEEWVRQCKNESGPNIKFILIGSKVDLEDE